MGANLSFLIFIFLFFCKGLFAQTSADSLSKAYYSQALSAIDIKDFNAADENFQKLLKLKKTLPDEMAYFYGYTLLQLNNFKTGRELLKKYIALRGDTGKYYNYAQTYLNYADCKEFGNYFSEEQCYECKGNGIATRPCGVCHGRGKELCPQCEGLGVIRKEDKLSDTFSTCPTCDGKELITCTTCNGKLTEAYKCYVCDGRGKVRIKKECDANIIGPGSDY